MPRADYEQAQELGKVFVTLFPTKPSVSAAGASVQPDNGPTAIGIGIFLVALLIPLYSRKKDREVEWGLLEEARHAGGADSSSAAASAE